MLLKLLSVVFWTRDVCADLQQALHVLEVFAVGVIESHPNVFDLVIFLEIDGGQIEICQPDELVLNPATIQESDGNVCVFRILRSLK